MFNTKEKKERALGAKLFLKGERCSSPKCAMVRKPYRPGVHGKTYRRSISEVGRQLIEKQKIRLTYGLKESQLKKIFRKAITRRKVISQEVISLLERRLDNTVYRLGFAPSRAVARQVINHGHILVNGRKVNIPSYEVKVGDNISINPKSLNSSIFKDLETSLKKYEPPEWLVLDKEKKTGKVKSLPKDAELIFDINLVVDHYSKKL